MSEGTIVGWDDWIGRRLELERLLARRSVFLLGPRQTGKTTYVRRQLRDTVELTFTVLDQGCSPRYGPIRRASDAKWRRAACATPGIRLALRDLPRRAGSMVPPRAALLA